jgi:hypothetical protein
MTVLTAFHTASLMQHKVLPAIVCEQARVERQRDLCHIRVCVFECEVFRTSCNTQRRHTRVNTLLDCQGDTYKHIAGLSERHV